MAGNHNLRVQLLDQEIKSLMDRQLTFIMKPLLSSGSSIDLIKAEMNEWQDLIMDTYLKLKEDSTQRQTEPTNSPIPRHGTS